MKLGDHVERIRTFIDNAFRNRLGRMGITSTDLQPLDSVPVECHNDRTRIETILEALTAETGSASEAYEKLVEEFTFTLFNRLAALKVMEAHTLHPEIITRRTQHGERSFSHMLWLEQNPESRYEELEGLILFIEDQLKLLSSEIPLFSLDYPYHLLPTAIELKVIIDAVNEVEIDAQVETNIWESDDVLGWLYESYNNYKKKAHKESKKKTEYNKVSIQSQVYTPRWVVKFLVDNSLGKLYLEMFPESLIKEKYKIANAPQTQMRDKKPLTEVRLIDPATGSGNFLLYSFDLFYDLYIDQINNYGADYDERNIPSLIIHNNLYGVDLDDRAIQLAQLALYIKAKRKKLTTKIEYFNIVSSDFYLPEYKNVKHLFENNGNLPIELEELIIELWSDLQQAYKFGSLIMIEEKFTNKLEELESGFKKFQIDFFESAQVSLYYNFRQNFFGTLQDALAQNAEKQGITFLNTKTSDAISFMQILTQKYDVAVANPPYTDSSDFGSELKQFIDLNYKQPYKFNVNLYSVFIKRCYDLIENEGKMALIHPLSFMYISSYENVRQFILTKLQIELLVEYGLGGIFTSKVDVDVAGYVFAKSSSNNNLSYFINLQEYKGLKIKKQIFEEAFEDYLQRKHNKHNFSIDQSKLKVIDSWPFIYWISDGFREKFQGENFDDVLNIVTGLMTGNNDKFLRYKWEVKEISKCYQEDMIKWVPYQKGGDFNRWYGNNWLVVNFESEGKLLATTDNKRFYFREGITYSATSSKGVAFRKIDSNQIFDKKGSCIFLKNANDELLYYCLAVLNSKLISYIAECLNSTVETQVGDIKRIPFEKASSEVLNTISELAIKNIEIKKENNKYRLLESEFVSSPLLAFDEENLRERAMAYLVSEVSDLSLLLINEAIINKLVFDVYALNSEDRLQVEVRMRKPVGEYPVLQAARQEYLSCKRINNEIVENYICNIPLITYSDFEVKDIVSEFATLYQSNNELEDFCDRHHLNPITVWYWFRQEKIMPLIKSTEIGLEFIAHAFKEILMEDEDGIIPLIGLPVEPQLVDRLEHYCNRKGITTAQFAQLEQIIGKPINEYIKHNFFENFCNQLNLFRNLPKTPYIWHLSSGTQQAFEVYIIIYKWNRDSLYKLKTNYISKRVEGLEYRQIELADSYTAQAQKEKEIIRLQLQEISIFKLKLDELIAEGYNPMLDDGVGKNIAPLQKKGMLKCDVLNEKQLEKYLKADW